MKGLLYKDWCTLVSRYKKNFILIFVLYVGLSILADLPFLLYAMVFVLGLYVQSAVGFDEHSHWDVYAHTLPIRRATIVGSKYILGGGAIAAGFVLSMMVFSIYSGVSSQIVSFDEALIGNLTAAAVSMLYFSLSIPLTYRFGSDRARTVSTITILTLVLGVFLLVNRLPEKFLSPEQAEKFTEWLNSAERFFGFRGPAAIPDSANDLQVTIMEVEYGSLNQWASNPHFWWLIGGLVLVSAALFALSWAISTAIYNRKQY